jgi:hypothetical protein
MSKIQRKLRQALVINYLSFIIFLSLFYLVRHGVFHRIYILANLLPLAGIIASFHVAFGKSQLWKLTHSVFGKLDERETELVFRATTISYSIFSIICLVMIYVFSLIGLGAIDVLLAAFLLYLAHSLPAAIIAWNQKVVTETE